MTPEELLKPRYKVIADYPSNAWRVGDILYPFNLEQEAAAGLPDIRRYPHLFQKLEWWEERKHSELPLYVKKKDNGVFFKVEGWRTSPNTAQITGAYINNDGSCFERAALFVETLIPVTEDEYNEYFQITIKDKI